MEYNFPLHEQNENAQKFDEKFPELEDLNISLEYFDRKTRKRKKFSLHKQHVRLGDMYIECPREHCVGKIFISELIKTALKNNKSTSHLQSIECGKALIWEGKKLGNCDINDLNVDIELVHIK